MPTYIVYLNDTTDNKIEIMADSLYFNSTSHTIQFCNDKRETIGSVPSHKVVVLKQG